jgi:hypothetical protein
MDGLLVPFAGARALARARLLRQLRQVLGVWRARARQAGAAARRRFRRADSQWHRRRRYAAWRHQLGPGYDEWLAQCQCDWLRYWFAIEAPLQRLRWAAAAEAADARVRLHWKWQ